MRIKYLKLILYVTFIFLTTNFILGMNYVDYINGYVFLWTLLISAGIYSEINLNSITKKLISSLIFIPVFLVNGVVCRIAVLIVGLLVISIQKMIKAEMNYEQALYQIRIMFFTAIAMIIISLMATDRELVNEYIIPYVILYVAFSIINLRTLRNYKYNVVNRKLRNINTIYLVVIIFFSAVLSVKQVRNIFSIAVSILYKGISYIIYKIGCFLSFLLFKIFDKIHISKETEEKFFELFKRVFGGPVEKKDIPVQAESHSFWAQYGISIIINIIITVVILFVIYKLVNAKYNKKKIIDNFIEKRESIIITDKGKDKKNIYRSLKKGSYKDKIRYYYYKLLKDCFKKNINILNSDTTKEINYKAQALFDKNCLDNMRQIYLKAKYTDNECTSQDFEGFYNSYKRK